MNKRKPHRVKLSRAKGSKIPPGSVRVTRPGMWGNPFRVGDPGTPDAATAVVQFERVMEDCLNPRNPASKIMRAALRTIKGRNLACWCRLDQPCHAEVLLRLANECNK